MSLYSGLRMSQALGGILGYSGAMIGSAGAQKLPVHLIHGEDDDVVPVDARAHAQQVLEDAGMTVSGHTSPNLTHSIDEKGIESGGKFLKEILNL
jgi:phospholipase/carboxylesterase